MLQVAPSISSQEDIAKCQCFVKGKLVEHYEAEHNPERETSMWSLPDARIDVCLYLLEPHLMHELDSDAIVALGKLLPIVPLIAKVSQCMRCRTMLRIVNIC